MTSRERVVAALREYDQRADEYMRFVEDHGERALFREFNEARVLLIHSGSKVREAVRGLLEDDARGTAQVAGDSRTDPESGSGHRVLDAGGSSDATVPAHRSEPPTASDERRRPATYLVFVEGTRPPKFKHGTLKAAATEAKRLADQTGRRAWLLKCKGIHHPTPPALRSLGSSKEKP